MKTACKISVLIILAVLVTVISIYWTPNVILCVPALVFFSLSIFSKKEKKQCNPVSLSLITLSISTVILVLQILVLLDKNVLTCSITALIMSVLNTIFLFWLWYNRPQTDKNQ